MSRDKRGAGRAVMIGAEAQGRAGADTATGHASSHPASVWAAAAPETRYAKSEDGYVAYQVFGRGSFDLLFIGNWASNVEVMWEHPSMARYLDRLGQFARVICFDKRGAGLSDPVAQGALPTLEHWMDDARIVLDAAGSETAALIGDAEGGPMAMMFAASYPQRSRALVLVNTFARMLRAADYPIGMPEEAAERFLRIWERSWGTGVVLELSAPTSRPLPGEGRRHDRGRVPGNLRRPGSRRPVRLRDRLRGPIAGYRDSSGVALRRGGDPGRASRRDRGAHCRAGHGTCRRRPGAGVRNGEGSGGRFINSVRRPRVSPAEGHPRRMAPV